MEKCNECGTPLDENGTCPNCEHVETSNTQTQDTPTEVTSAQDAQKQATLALAAPSQETPAKSILMQETPTQETPTQETPTQETPTQETPAQETPTQETLAQETPTQETPTQETQKQATLAELLSDQKVSQEQPTERTRPSTTHYHTTPVYMTGVADDVSKKSKMCDLLCAFFLGGIGIHKFYEGKFGLGLTYLLFCWTTIPSIIAFVECVIILLNKATDSEGNRIVEW